MIDNEFRSELWAYMGGIARKNGMHALAVGGTDDHVHLLLTLPAIMPISKAVQLIKGGSSRWVSEDKKRDFAWQSGYGAFTIGVSQCDTTIAYIGSQEEHHKRVDFRTEFLSFLKKHGIDYDERYLWG